MSADVLISTPALKRTYLPEDREYNEDWTPIALAIQRGRDHGIPAYHEAVNLCANLNNNHPVSFEELQNVTGLSDAQRRLLQRVYLDAADVDLLAGALSEDSAPGTVFGPTLSCLLALQFANLRNSDRFWYENDIPPSSLSLEQLQAVRRTTLAGLMCATEAVRTTQPKAFIQEDPYLNYRQTCDQIAGLDLSAWKATEEAVQEAQNEELVAASNQSSILDELNPELVKAAMERARETLEDRRRFEYQTWLNRKS